LSADIDTKYDIIYGYEEQFAYRLAREVVAKPETSVWMILIPILLVHHMFKVSQYKENTRQFAKNILSTKQKALDKAYKQAVSGKRLNYTHDDYFPGVPLSSKQDRVLADKQVRVIRIMEEHYLAMLNARGDSLEALIRGVYRNSGEYRRYLNRLTDSEKEVSRHLLEHFHTTDESREVVKNIEKQCSDLRELEVNFFFKH